ncbi:DRTGG domain-containing protein [Ruminiclostridium sufflavum DSM 19573]|uniref:DRTGG domain-containing protein n=1 Tax=Ruminiclostridium sufflavum DSM 19573 TaxID=1121337 RepID=A0A318XP20_9FIRM|nr:DRTGG domain-containing protein [Ruminiclostridium sufflavum]PYG88793.1 DRTGG domain-containing protein [Ruminiclostridium sufflavum DSM 19573]
MRLGYIAEILDAQVICGGEFLELEVTAGCGSDLMSDVMAYVTENVILLTGLINLQVIRTAEMMDIKAIIFVRGKLPIDSMIELAREKNIVLMSTKLSMFIACGRLYNAGLQGKS